MQESPCGLPLCGGRCENPSKCGIRPQHTREEGNWDRIKLEAICRWRYALFPQEWRRNPKRIGWLERSRIVARHREERIRRILCDLKMGKNLWG